MEFSNVDSSRFGVRVYRGTLDEVRVNDLFDEIIRERIDVAIIRLRTECYNNLNYLEKMGFPFLVADTLVYYTTDLSQHSPRLLRNNDLEFHACGVKEHRVIDNLVDRIFSGYINHYTSNPLLKKTDILEGYKEWARAYCDAEKQGRLAWIVYRKGEPIAFLTCLFVKDACEGILYGVTQEASGGGVYGDLIRFSQAFFKIRGCKTMKVSTQVHNVAVQKIWVREGFYPTQSFMTVHINSFMDASSRPVGEIDFRIRGEDVRRIGQTIGDFTPIHFDDNEADVSGFSHRACQEYVSGEMLSRYFGTVYPGPGTFFTGYSYKFLKPLYPDVGYHARISFPLIDSDHGVFKAAVQIYNPDGELCLLSYNDLINRQSIDCSVTVYSPNK